MQPYATSVPGSASQASKARSTADSGAVAPGLVGSAVLPQPWYHHAYVSTETGLAAYTNISTDTGTSLRLRQ
eukprot:102895-Rhodomonas_salina.4